MKIRKKNWRSELAWIVSLSMLTWLADFLLFGKSSVLQETIDIQIHDTYYVISGISWIAILFILIATVAYVFKEIRYVYRRPLPNVILLVLVAAVLFFVSGWHHIVISGGWVVYPPLSTPEMQEVVSANASEYEQKNFTFIATKALLGIGLLLLSVRTAQVAKQT